MAVIFFHCKLVDWNWDSNSCVHVKPCLTAPWTVAHQAPLSMELSRQEYWSGLPFPTPGDLSDPGIEPASPPVNSLPLSHLGSLGLLFSFP